MVKQIVRDVFFLGQPSEPATKADIQVGKDLQDTLRANRERCVGMAANMIGVKKNIIIVNMGFIDVVMFNPVIVSKHDMYETEEGCLSLEQLEKNPARFLPKQAPAMSPAVDIDLDEGMDKVREILTKYPIKTRLNLRGTLIVARDIAHARIKQMLDEGKPMPDYFKKHPVYYAGPAKTPEGMASGSFGPTTAGRMDPYVDLFQSHGGSMVMVAKGNRSQAVTDACRKHGGFYLGSIGGPAAILAKNSIKSVEVVDFPELGMEAVRKIYVEDFPAFVIVDDKGNDFFADFKH